MRVDVDVVVFVSSVVGVIVRDVNCGVKWPWSYIGEGLAPAEIIES
jgi:hypothetical protein